MIKLTHAVDAARTSVCSLTSANALCSTSTTTTDHGTLHPISTATAKSTPDCDETAS